MRRELTEKKLKFLAAYGAGREAYERSRLPVVLAAFFGAILDRVIQQRYSLRWFESLPITVLVIVVLALFFNLLKTRFTRE
jgi:hypothetical protein